MRTQGFGLTTALVALVGTACSATVVERPLLIPAPGSPIAVVDSPGSIGLGDVNQDGKPDLVAAGGRSVTVLLGEGDGRFHAASGGPIHVTDPPTELVLQDLNGDAKPDLALGSHDSYGVAILLGDGKGGFTPAPGSPVVMREGHQPHTHGLNAGDLNGDGAFDLVSVNSNDNDVSIAFGDGKGGFTRAESPFAVGASPYPGALSDLNGDGNLDIIATSTGRHTHSQESSTNALTVLFGDGRGSFRRGAIPLRTVLPWFVAVADVNGDRKSDLVVTHAERSELTVLLGNGSGAFTETAGSPFNLGHYAWHQAVADLNGDNRPDVVAAAGDGVRVMLGDGRGGFRTAPGSPFATGKGAWQLVVGDLNGDGKPDVATSNLESGTVTVLLGS
jgi:FG-GAP-like repeat